MSLFSIIITAGGIGSRMGEVIPKQFIELRNKPILLYTLELFHKFDPDAQLIITLPEEWKVHWEQLMLKFNCSIPHQLISGGDTRYQSVKNALNSCTGNFIAIHDGVRPFVSRETLKRCFTAVIEKEQVIPVVYSKESLRQLFDDTSRAVNREEFCLVQTPQCFKKENLLKAYVLPFHSSITDDASLVEEAGFQISLVEGNEENIKITSPIDLKLAECILNSFSVQP